MQELVECEWHAGVGNMPDLPQQGWLPWLRQQRKKGLQVRRASRHVFLTFKPHRAQTT